MRRLARERGKCARGGRERGVALIIVTISIVALVAIGALAVDAAVLHQERRELQNGADAAALAVAEDCARGACGPMVITAETYADGNAKDNRMRVLSVTPIGNQVTVQVATEQASGGPDGSTNTVDFTFARIFGIDGQEVKAKATARWAPVGTARTLPLTFSRCEWAAATSDGTVYYNLNADGQLDPIPTDPPTVITFHQGGGGSDCAAQAGQDINSDGRLPGGFGWLQSTNCQVTIVAPGWVAAKPGNGPPSDCDPDDLLNKAILLPVFADESASSVPSCTIGPGGKCYLVRGFAEFFITGFRFPGGGWNRNAPCGAPNTCLGGYFTKPFVSVADALGGTSTENFGPLVIELIA